MRRVKLGDVLVYEQPTKYIVKSEQYRDEYEIPVLTAGKTFILGYTNEKNGIYSASDNDAIILFDDFTTDCRYINFKFKVKSSAVKILKLNSECNDNIKYLYYVLKNIIYDTTSHKRYWISQYANIEINLPSIEEQNRIVYELEKIEKMIENKHRQEEKLDMLIRAKFLKMFGSPFDNKKFESKKLGDISILISDGSNIDTTLYQEKEDVLFFRIQNVWRNEFRLDDSVYISKETNQKYKSTSLLNGDILISKIGRFYTKDSSLGRVALYRGENNKANYSNNIMRIRLKEGYNSEFINIVLNLKEYQQFIRNESKGGTDKRALSKKVIENFPVLNPPMDSQMEFINIVKIIDAQKENCNSNIKCLNKILECKMQEYFGGETNE